MADNRELTFGMDFGLDDAINRLGETIDRLEQIVDRAQDVEAVSYTHLTLPTKRIV